MKLFASRTSLSTSKKTGPYILNRNLIQGKTAEGWALLDPFSELHRKKTPISFWGWLFGYVRLWTMIPKDLPME